MQRKGVEQLMTRILHAVHSGEGGIAGEVREWRGCAGLPIEINISYHNTQSHWDWGPWGGGCRGGNAKSKGKAGKIKKKTEQSEEKRVKEKERERKPGR